MSQSSTRVARGVLVAMGIVFLAVGLAYLLSPVTMMSYVDVQVESATARNDIRAVYGGVNVGLGVFFLFSAARANWLAPALFASLLVFVALVAGRIASLVLDGTPSVMIFLVAAVETGGIVASAWGLLGLRSKKREERETEGPAALDVLK